MLDVIFGSIALTFVLIFMTVELYQLYRRMTDWYGLELYPKRGEMAIVEYPDGFKYAIWPKDFSKVRYDLTTDEFLEWCKDHSIKIREKQLEIAGNFQRYIVVTFSNDEEKVMARLLWDITI